MTRVSLVPGACESTGVSFASLLDLVIGETLFQEDSIPAV